tara:strand:+ start:225 stop:608 length:384 start_codon:yes stop_codon:yes gene_type:complete
MYQAKRNNFPFLFLIVLICLIKLFHIGYYRIHFSPNLLFHTFERDFANNKAVSDIVLEANQLIEKAKIVDFNLSNNLILNDYFKQRIVEFSYPIRLNKNSKFIIAPSDLKLNCKINLESERIKLYEC